MQERYFLEKNERDKDTVFYLHMVDKIKERNHKSMCHYAHQELFTRENIN